MFRKHTSNTRERQRKVSLQRKAAVLAYQAHTVYFKDVTQNVGFAKLIMYLHMT